MPKRLRLPLLLLLWLLSSSLAASRSTAQTVDALSHKNRLKRGQHLRTARHSPSAWIQLGVPTDQQRRLLDNTVDLTESPRSGDWPAHAGNLSKSLSTVCGGKKNGTPLKDVAVCTVRVSGADAAAALLHGGLDGVYTPMACVHGRPSYLRQESPPNESRVLWWSAKFGDWDVMNGTKAAQPSLDPLLYGGGHSDLRPQHVQQWHLATEFQIGPIARGTVKLDYRPVNITIACLGEDAEAAAGGAPPQLAGPAGGLATLETTQLPQQGQTGSSSDGAGRTIPREMRVSGKDEEERRGPAGKAGGEGGWGAGGKGAAELGAGSEAAEGQLSVGAGQGEGLGVVARELKEPLLVGGAGGVREQGWQQQAPMLWVRARAFREQSSARALLGGLFIMAAVTLAVGWPLAVVQRGRSRAAVASSPGRGVSVYLSLDPQGGRARRKMRL